MEAQHAVTPLTPRAPKGIDLEKLPYKHALSVAEAAFLAGLSKAYFYDILAEGKGPRQIKTGKRVRILRDDLTQWLKRQYRKQPEASAA
jgi:excisionase family DNA binding protein